MIHCKGESLGVPPPRGPWGAKMSWQQASLNSPEKAREKSLKNGWWGVDASGIRLMKTSVSTVPAKYAESCRYFESLKALLFSAIQGGHMEIVKLLIERGIDYRISYTSESMNDMDAEAFARKQGQTEIANYIAERKRFSGV